MQRTSKCILSHITQNEKKRKKTDILYMKKILTFAMSAALAALLTSCGGSDSQKKDAETEGKEVEVPTFCADSAYAYVAAQCAFGPRVMNSEAHDKCGDYIAEKFKEFGAEVISQNAELTRYDGMKLKARNIIASYNSGNPIRVMICGHWDSRPWADNDKNDDKHQSPIDGANDGASSVGVMLEMARQIQAKAPEIGVDFICFDAEDSGKPQWAEKEDENNEATWCLGSQYWSANMHKEDYFARYGILLDMVGGRGSVFMKEGFSVQYASDVVDKVWKAAEKCGYSAYFKNVGGGYVTDDHLPVNRIAGIPCIDVIGSDAVNGGFVSSWHTVDDNMDNIDKGTLKAVGQTMMEVIYNEK